MDSLPHSSETHIWTIYQQQYSHVYQTGKKSLLIKNWFEPNKKQNKTKNKKEIDNLYICFVILFLFCQERKKTHGEQQQQRPVLLLLLLLPFVFCLRTKIHHYPSKSFSLFDLLFLLCFFCLLLSYKETILQGRNCYHQYLIRLSNWRIVQTKLKKEIFVYLWIYGTTHQLYYSATQVPHQPPPTFYFFCFFSENCRWVLAYDPFACWENMGK